MATNKSLSSMIAIEDTPEVPEFSIEVVQHIGNVYMGDGEHPPLRLAFMTISDHFANCASNDTDHFEYRITHPADGHQFTVTIEDPPYDPQG